MTSQPTSGAILPRRRKFLIAGGALLAALWSSSDPVHAKYVQELDAALAAIGASGARVGGQSVKSCFTLRPSGSANSLGLT